MKGNLLKENLRAVLFDVDDTLFDRTRAQNDLVRELAHRLDDLFAGIPFERTREAFFESDRRVNQLMDSGKIVEGARAERSRLFLGLLHLDESAAGRVTDEYMKLYPEINVPVKGSVQTLGFLHGRYQLGVVSNGFVDIQHHKLESLGIARLFDCVVLSDELGIRKPDPRIFEEALKRLGRTPDECLYVGDSCRYDVAGARNAGIRTCWFNPEGARRPPGESEPEFEIHSFSELEGVLG
jgi:HAD superfamily hydrolase (TIGR01509 family)